ncbi:hypothetical protein [Burkholderia sp. Ac-20379]|uniref:hypothetical protein n=1 Tax=Burkholderia sp. Ac-20379 TaxID=2703900 RepID=UPI001981DDA7|nr:hypothetical protein [Burkholderia sp. Ac-20379]MBN3723462.1 hypothetical protein [Burkholderia sp. Ac-20379]
MSSAVLVSLSRFVVSPPVAGYLPPPYGTFRGKLLGNFRSSGRRPVGPRSAYMSERWRKFDGAVGRTIAASAFGTDNNAWMVIVSQPVRRPLRAVALACCAILIGAFALVSVLRFMRVDSAVKHPMPWFDGRIGAQSGPAFLADIRRAPKQAAPRLAVAASARPMVRAASVRHIMRAATVVPAKHVGEAVARSVKRSVHRPHPVRTAHQTLAPKKQTPARVRVVAHRQPSPAPRVFVSDDWRNDDTLRAIRNELARQDAAARAHAPVSRDMPANAVSLLNYQVRLTAR